MKEPREKIDSFSGRWRAFPADSWHQVAAGLTQGEGESGHADWATRRLNTCEVSVAGIAGHAGTKTPRLAVEGKRK